jgi:hypothetical protein
MLGLHLKEHLKILLVASSAATVVITVALHAEAATEKLKLGAPLDPARIAQR